jgi:hypothetical protein
MLPTLATSTVPVAATPQENAPPESVSFGPESDRPAWPIGFAVAATMRTGFEAARVLGGKNECAGVESAGAAGQEEPSVLTASVPLHTCA